ncbi:MAG TPA: hypothetical protein PK095_06490 [Myxococcota bacterium]|jgi:hypothetical protein|nr:hypothetical protein [Myxococcota bacterium]
MFDIDDDSRDPRNPSAMKRLDTHALARAVQSLRYLDQFHTLDVVKHPTTTAAHRNEHDNDDFPELVEFWLKRETLFLGLRGPLPGHSSRGSRWAWQVAAADPTDGKGGPRGHE